MGSTRLKQEPGDQLAVGLIQQHHALMREVLTNFEQAEEIETAGDSFLLVFARPSAAARLALISVKDTKDSNHSTRPLKRSLATARKA